MAAASTARGPRTTPRVAGAGTADNTTVGRGEIVIFDGGTGFFTSVTGTAPGSGGIETVFAGGFAFATTLDGDGAQQFVYGFGSSTSVNSGGSLIVGAGGSATRAQVFQSGSLDVQGGGIALSASI